MTKHLVMLDYRKSLTKFFGMMSKFHYWHQLMMLLLTKYLSKQAVTKLIEKKDRDKSFFKNWRLISLLNTDLKLIPKTLTTQLKDILSDLISSNQTTYVKNRYVSESVRLTYDVLETASILNKKGFLVTINIRKAFSSVDRSFFLADLKKYGFGEHFLKWIQILTEIQDSCVVNGGITTKFVSLDRWARQ